MFLSHSGCLSQTDDAYNIMVSVWNQSHHAWFASHWQPIPVLHKIQAPNGSSPLATETRATSGTSAHLLMQLHNVTARLFMDFHKIVKNLTNETFRFCNVDCFFSSKNKSNPYRCVRVFLLVSVCPIGELYRSNERSEGGRDVVMAHLSHTVYTICVYHC